MTCKKSIALLLSGSMLAAAALTGCGSDNTAAAVSNTAGKDLLDQIQARGSITVAMEGTWAPWTYHDENDELVGYDVEVAKLIANELGVDVNFVEGEWDGLLAGLDDGRYDIMVNGVGVTPERQEKYDFSVPYAYNKTAVIVRSDYDEIHSMEDLKGKHTANTISSTYATLAEKYGAEVTGVDDLNQTIELLLSNRIDATLNTEVTYYDYLKAHPDADIKIAALSDEVEKVAQGRRYKDAACIHQRRSRKAGRIRRADRIVGKILRNRYFEAGKLNHLNSLQKAPVHIPAQELFDS